MTDYIGQTFDRYHLLTSLGVGGMATVYKAYDMRLERDVAVKIIRTEMFVPALLQQVLKRFEREAKSLAKLSHPNIVSIIDYGEHDGVPYLVMEYLPGGTLKDRLKGQPIPWQHSIRLLLPVARALQFSHQQGIIHRDVKPSNILITLSGEPMLSDFGIAKILENEGSTALTGTGVGIGTPEYMAPEQWVGNTSPQSDMYSLGLVLYEMVTGCKPFMADTPAAILIKQVNDPLPRPRQYASDLPDRLEKIIFKTLAKKPENRYSSMEEFSSSLESLLAGQTQIKPPTVRSGTPKPESPQQPEGEVHAGPPQIGDRPTIDAHLPVEGTPAGPASRPINSVKTRLVSFGKRLGEMARPGKIRSSPVWLIGLVALVAGLLAFAVWGLPARKAGSAPLPSSGGYVYFTSDQSDRAEIYYLDSKGNPVQFTHTPDQHQSWSPVYVPGGYVYFTSDQSGKREIYYLDPKGNAVQFTHTSGQAESWSPAYVPGGNVFFTSDQSGKAEVYYLDAKGNPVQFTHTPGPYQSWSPFLASGGYVYFTSDQTGKREIYYLDSKGNAVQFTHTSGQAQSWSPAYAPGGYVFFTSDQNGKAEVYYLDAKGNPVQFTHTPGPYQSWSPFLAPDGYVYFTSDQSGKAEVYYMDSKGNPVQFTHTRDQYRSGMVFSPSASGASRP